MNQILTNELLQNHTVTVSNPVPLGEALLILGGAALLFVCIIKFGAPWFLKEIDKW